VARQRTALRTRGGADREVARGHVPALVALVDPTHGAVPAAAAPDVCHRGAGLATIHGNPGKRKPAPSLGLGLVPAALPTALPAASPGVVNHIGGSNWD